MSTVEERIKDYKRSKAAGSTSVPAFSTASAKNTVEDRIRQYKLEKKIGFDTFEKDLASASDLVNTVYGGWQSADTMGSGKNTVSSMRSRLNAYKAYANSYSRDTDLTQFNSGIDQLISAYNSALSDWDSIAGTYSNFVNASAYDKAKKNYELSQKYAGLDYNGVQEAILQNPEDKEFLSQYGVNVGYSDLREYNRDILGTAKKITESSGAEKDALQKYLKKMKTATRVYELDHKFDLYRDLMNNEDFEELSVYQPKQKKGIQIFPNKDEDEYDLVNDSAQKNFNAFNNEMFNAGVPMNKYNFEQMTTDEVAVYNYLYHKDRVEGTDALNAYKKDMQIVWNKRATEANDKRIEKLADESALASVAMTVESVPQNIVGVVPAFISNTLSTIKGEKINPYSYAHRDLNASMSARRAVGSNIAEATQGMEIAGVNVPSFLYDVGLSVADSAVGIALLGEGYTVAASMGAAAQRAKELKEQGASETQIIMGSAASGIAEAFFEKFSVDNLLKVKNADTIGKLVKETMKQIGIEASEEVFTELANIVSDTLIRGDLSDAAQTMSAYMNQGYSEKEAIMKVALDLTKDVALAGIGGAISGGVMGGAKGAYEYTKYNSTGKTITGNNRTDVLADIAKMSEDKNIQEYLKLLNEDKASKAQIGSLYAQVARELDADKKSKTDASKRETVASRLVEMGEDSQTAQNTASAVYKYLFPGSSTEKLTAEERAALKTENAKAVISEIKHNADWFLNSEMSQEAQEAVWTRNRLEDIIKQPKSETKVKAEQRAAEMNTGAETIDNTTKEKISIEGIRTDKNGNTFLQTSAGERSLEDVTLTESDAEIVAMAEGMESDKANLFVSLYTQGVNTEDYKDSFDLAYIYGVNAYGVESVIKNRGVLTARQTAAVYKLGIQNSTAETQARIDKLTKKHNTGIQAGKFNDSTIDYKKLNKRQQAAVAFVKMFSEKTGINVEFFESTADENGRRTMENGRFDKSTNTIYLDAYAGLNENIFEDSIISTLSHELTHWLQDKAPEAYSRLSGIVMDMLSKDRKASPEVLVAAEQRRYKNAHGEEVSEEYARDELIARTCEDMLSNSERVTEYLSRMDETTAKTIGSRLKEAISKLKAWISDLLRAYKSSSTEAKILRKYNDTLTRIQKIWDEAFEKAVMANQAMKDAYNSSVDEDLYKYIKDSLNDTTSKKSFYKLADTISERLADDIEQIVGFSVQGYGNEIAPSNIKHIENEHGANGRSDQSMQDLYDLAKIKYVIDNYDKIREGKGARQYKNKDGSSSKTIELQKKIEERYYYVVEAVPDSQKRTLHVVSAYINKNDTFSEVAVQKSPSRYVQDEQRSNVSNNSIPQNQEKSSVKFSGRENIDLEAELATYNLDGKWNDYIGIQKNVIGKLRKEGFFEDNEVINKDSGMVIRITAKGIKETLGAGKRFQSLPRVMKELKIATIRNLPNIIENGIVSDDNVQNYHDENGDLYAYITSDATIDGVKYGVRVSVKKKVGSNIFWIHHVDTKKGSDLLDPSRRKELKENQNLKLNIAQENEKVNTNFWIHNADGDKKSPELLNLRAQGRGNYETQDSEDSIQQSGEKVNINFSEREAESVYDAVGELQRVQAENEKIREDIERLRQKNRLERTLAGGSFLSESHLTSIAEHILKKADSGYSKESFLAELKDIYGYLQREDVEWDIFMTKVTDTALRIIADRKGKIVPNDYAKDILSMIRNTKVSFNDAQKAEAEYAYGKGWRRNYFGKVAVTDEGVPLDTAWQEWTRKYPDMFDADISAADMATEVLYAYDVARASSEVVEAYDKSEAARNISFEIYNQFWNAAQVKGISDKDSTAIKKLKYEHRVAIKELRERYLERYYIEHRDMKPLYQQTIKNLLQKRDEDIARVKEYTKEYKEKLEKRSQIDKITKKSLKLNTWLVKNSKEAHVAEILKKPVAAILKSLNFSSERLLGIRKGKHTGEPTRKDISLSKAFEHLRDTVSSISDAYVNEDTVNDLYGYIDMPPDFAEFVNKMSGEINDILREVGDNEYILNQMTTEQLKDINKLLTTLTHMVTSANKAFAGAHGKTIKELADDTIAYAEKLGTKSKFSGKVAEFFHFDNALPIYAFERFGDAAQKIFEGLQDGWDKLSFHVKQITEYVENAYKAEEVKKWSREVHEFELADDVRKDTVKITAAQIMYLYCLQKREQAVGHLLGCGIRVKDFKDGRKTISQPKGATLTESDIKRMVAELTPRQKEVADKLQSFMNAVCSDWGNEISMVRFGYKMFNEVNYIPITSDKNQHANDTPKENAGSLFRLLNMSFTKSLTKGANSRIIIDNIFDVFAAHTSDMAKYNALALPVLDAFKWHSYHKNIEVNAADKEDKRKISVGVKQSLEYAYGEGANRYITRFLEDLNGANSGGMTNTEKLSRKLMSNYKIAAVGANIRVAILQPTSYVRASAVIAPKYLVAAFAHRPQIQKAKDTCGMAQWKSMGFYSTNISKGVAALIKHEETFVDKLREGSMKLAELGDSVTWGYLYNACEAEISDTKPELSGTDKDEAVAKRLREVIYRTQVVDSTMTRTQTMRNPSTMSQMLTSFMSEAMVSYNLLHGLSIQFNADKRIYGASKALKKNGRNILRATMAYLVTSLCSAFAGGFIDTLRDDEEDAEFGELFFANVQDNALSDVVGMLPLMRDLASVYKGYGSGRMDMQGFESAVNATKKLMKSIENRELTYSAVYSAAKTVSQISGLPGSNAIREFKTIWNNTIGEVYESMKIE